MAFMRYADARMSEREQTEVYRIYVAKHLQALVGSSVDYYALAHAAPDFDAGQVVDGVISKMGLEEG